MMPSFSAATATCRTILRPTRLIDDLSQ
jgi:hypothetical protein